MSTKYILPCSCGQEQVIEVSQAGQTIICSCGNAVKVPTMIKIKGLRPVPEVREAPRETGVQRQAFFFAGLVLLAPSLIYLLYLVLPVFSSYPQPRDVSRKQVEFTYGQTKVFQDSTPIPNFERQVLWMEDEYFDTMTPTELYYYFLWLKQGPEFSYNFLENYQSLQDAYWIRVAAASALVVLALMSLVVSCFMPKQNVVVLGWSGTEW